MDGSPEPAARAERDARESPDRRERSEASDRPRSGERAAGESSNEYSERSFRRILTDGGEVAHDASIIYRPSPTAPSVSETGSGYQYVRCQRGNHDDTVYIHQLCAIASGADPHDVFGDQYDVHHVVPTDWLDSDSKTDNGKPYLNTPETVVLVPVWAHRVGHLEEANERRDDK